MHEASGPSRVENPEEATASSSPSSPGEQSLGLPIIWPALIIGHRGASGDAPENTMAAFELAEQQGADGVELDVHLSADGVPVVIHDARLERTTSGAGRVRDASLAALKRLDAGAWFNRRYPSRARSHYAGQKIPTLAEALGWVRMRRMQAYVEIKLGSRAYPGIETLVLEAITHSGAAPLVTIISFNYPTLARLRQLDSRIRLGMDFTRPLLVIRRARLIGSDCILPHWALATRRLIRRAHKANLQVLAWDLDQPRRIRRKILDGIDGAVTRYPAKMKLVRDSVQKQLSHGHGGRARN